MATAAKAKNGNMVVDVVNDAAAEAKIMGEAFVNGANKANEEAKMVLDAQQKMLEANFETMQKYSQFHIDFIVKATQQSFDQSLAMREQLGKVFEANFKKTQELMTSEQELMIEATEAFQAQSHAAAERFTKLLTPNFK